MPAHPYRLSWPSFPFYLVMRISNSVKLIVFVLLISGMIIEKAFYSNGKCREPTLFWYEWPPSKVRLVESFLRIRVFAPDELSLKMLFDRIEVFRIDHICPSSRARIMVLVRSEASKSYCIRNTDIINILNFHLIVQEVIFVQVFNSFKFPF